jgi:hypothetical protein
VSAGPVWRRIRKCIDEQITIVGVHRWIGHSIPEKFNLTHGKNIRIKLWTRGHETQQVYIRFLGKEMINFTGPEIIHRNMVPFVVVR